MPEAAPVIIATLFSNCILGLPFVLIRQSSTKFATKYPGPYLTVSTTLPRFSWFFRTACAASACSIGTVL